VRGDAELQFVVSVTRAEGDELWDVRVGLELVGQVEGEADFWRWRRGDLWSGPLPDRMTATLELLGQVQREHGAHEDEAPAAGTGDDEALTLRYEDEATGRRMVLYRCLIRCTSCGEFLPGSHFGMRKINDLLYRSQPQCSRCRSIKRPAAV
jgi:hypothetical protein